MSGTSASLMLFFTLSGALVSCGSRAIDVREQPRVSEVIPPDFARNQSTGDAPQGNGREALVAGCPIPPALREYSLRDEIERVERERSDLAAQCRQLIGRLLRRDRDERATIRFLDSAGPDIIPFLVEGLYDFYWNNSSSMNEFIFTQQSIIVTTIQKYALELNPERSEYIQGLLWEQCLRGKIGTIYMFTILHNHGLSLIPGEQDRLSLAAALAVLPMFEANIENIAFIARFHPSRASRESTRAYLWLIDTHSEPSVRDRVQEVQNLYRLNEGREDTGFSHPLVAPPGGFRAIGWQGPWREGN